MHQFAQPGLSSLQFCTLPLASRDRRNQGLGAHRDGGARHPRARQPLARGPGGAARSRRRAPGARGAASAQHPARLAARTQRTSCARRKSRRPPKHLLLSAPAALLCGFAGVAARRSARRLAEVAAEVDSCPRIRARADPAGALVLAANSAAAIVKDFFAPVFLFYGRTFREALLTYNRYGTLPGPPQPGCSPPQAPCSSIAFSMRVNFRENATAARCAVPACSPAQGARLATQFCQSAIFQGPKPNGQDCPGGSANETTHDWLALKSGPGTPHRWRCYSPTVLSANHTAYQGGAEWNAFFPAIGMLKAINLPRQSRDKHSALVKLGEKGVFMQVLISVPRPPSSRAL